MITGITLLLPTIGGACVNFATTIKSNARNIMIVIGMVLVMVMAMLTIMLTIQVGATMLKNAPATMNHEARAETSVMALPASSRERQSIALDSGCFLTVSNMSQYFSLLKPSSRSVTGVGGEVPVDGEGNFSFDVHPSAISHTMGNTATNFPPIKDNCITSTGALFSTKIQFNLLSVHGLCLLGYRVTFVEGGEQAIISTPPDQDGVLTQYDAPFNALTQLYELPIMPHVEREEDDQDEAFWTLPAVLGGQKLTRTTT